MTIFREALAPFAARIVREHHVLHFAADLPPVNNSIELARGEILRWAKNRSGGKLPNYAMGGESFDLLAAGRNTSAVEVKLPEINAWALRQEDPDKDVAGRIWTSEAILWRTPNRSPRFAARLTVGSTEAELDITPSVPGYILQLATNIELTSGGDQFKSQPWYIVNMEEQDRLLYRLADPARRLPFVVFSVTDPAAPRFAINVDELAKGLCGLAQVIAILPETSWALTERFSKMLSVFDNGVRIYMPGFNEDADPYTHPLWLGARLATPQEASSVDRQIRTRVAQFSTRSIRMGEDILPFAQLRSISRKAEQDRLASSGASDAEQLSAAKDRIAALERERDEAKEMQEYALEEELRAQTRAEEAESRERNATAQIQKLLQQLKDSGTDQEQSQILPETWTEFAEWCDQTLVGRLTLTSAARRGCKKALFNDVKQAARCLIWLATTCRNHYLTVSGSLRDITVEEGLHNSPCGGDTFAFDWQSRRMDAGWHIKTGGNTRAPETCLRIYYAWDEHTQQIIVADMPAHRRTDAS